jgi:transcriptional regulator of arginine metabolism
MKRNRQEKMLELISRYEIDTQDELIARLRECGFDVTQATISRDIRELKIAKMMTGKGTYRYVLPKQSASGSGPKFSTALIDSIISVENACNIVVIKTYPGLANAVAVGIDNMNFSQILGCVAGDDTIMIATRDYDSAEMISQRMHELLKQF